MNPANVIRRFRGCFIGGPLHGADLPQSIQPGGRLRAPNPEGEPETVDYLHRRLEDAETGEELELLVLEGLDDAAAAALVDAERDRRGGWGDPLVTLPATGFRFKPETFMAPANLEADGGFTTELRLGVVTRFSRQGICIAAHLCDESRPLSREEADPTRCGWCEEGIGHTIEEHRVRVGATNQVERMLEIRPHSATELVDAAPMVELSLAIARILYGMTPDEEAIARYQAELDELTIREAHDEFMRRRRAELVVADQVEEETATLDVGAGLVIASGYRSRGA